MTSFKPTANCPATGSSITADNIRHPAVRLGAFLVSAMLLTTRTGRSSRLSHTLFLIPPYMLAGLNSLTLCPNSREKMRSKRQPIPITLRSATPADAGQIREIYAPYVRETAITFEYEVPSVEEFTERIERTLEHYPYIVAESEEGNILGYAYAGAYYGRAAYSRSVEVSIYVQAGQHDAGVGRRLYEALEEELRSRGFLNLTACIAWIDEPNRYLTHQSPIFHRHMGYEQCAHFHKIGFKFGRWFDIIWMEKMLGEHKDENL